MKPQNNDLMYYYRVCNAKGFYDFLAKYLAYEIHLNNVNCERKEILEGNLIDFMKSLLNERKIDAVNFFTVSSTPSK